MHAFLKDVDAESAESMMNIRQKVWVSQLRLVAQNAKSLFEEYSKAGWFLRLIIKRPVFAQEINYLLKEILSISDRKNIYSVANIIIQGTTQQELLVTTSTSPSIQEEREVRGVIEPPALVAASSYRSVTGLKGKVQSIRSEMELIDALFQDVQVMGGLDKRSRIWVDQMEGIGIEARSVINDYATNLEGKSFFTVLSKHQSRLLISNKIDDIRNTIEDASRRRKAYGLGQIQSRVVSSSSTVQIIRGRMQPSLVVAATKKSSIIGFGDDAQVLIAQLLTDEKCRCITWIVGIGGTGKTTLAELIFHDNAVISHFECRISVSLPSNLNSNYTAQQLLEEIAKEATKIIKGDPQSDLVLETLAGKKYLIVVDGIEETSQAYLDTLKQAIPDKSTGSRLLLTTRNATIARRHAA
ncbi:disease resistance protein rpp13-like, partial [Trifolium pratense]